MDLPIFLDSSLLGLPLPQALAAGDEPGSVTIMLDGDGADVALPTVIGACGSYLLDSRQL